MGSIFVLFLIMLLSNPVFIPSFLISYAAPDRIWLAASVVVVGAALLYKGATDSAEICTGMYAAFTGPERSHGWFVGLFALIAGAVIRSLMLLAGGKLDSNIVRIALAPLFLAVAPLTGVVTMGWAARALNFATCRGL